jgi:hypothetical protein
MRKLMSRNWKRWLGFTIYCIFLVATIYILTVNLVAIHFSFFSPNIKNTSYNIVLNYGNQPNVFGNGTDATIVEMSVNTTGILTNEKVATISAWGSITNGFGKNVSYVVASFSGAVFPAYVSSTSGVFAFSYYQNFSGVQLFPQTGKPCGGGFYLTNGLNLCGSSTTIEWTSVGITIRFSLFTLTMVV